MTSRDAMDAARDSAIERRSQLRDQFAVGTRVRHAYGGPEGVVVAHVANRSRGGTLRVRVQWDGAAKPKLHDFALLRTDGLRGEMS